MSFPYVIWTMQRTGGTTLAALLASLSEFDGIEHEPFNRERQLGHITRNWDARKNALHLDEKIALALTQRPLIKHCYELVPFEVTQSLFQMSQRRGYRHIILHRRSELDRLLSLELAKQTGAWGPEQAQEIYAQFETETRALAPIQIETACAHAAHCQRCSQRLIDMLKGEAAQVFEINFEDLYGVHETGILRLKALLRFLEIDVPDDLATQSRINRALSEKAQNSAELFQKIPNIEAVREALGNQTNPVSCTSV